MTESYTIKRIKKRDGSITLFNDEKITAAIEKAMQAVSYDDCSFSKTITKRVIETLDIFFKAGSIPTVESIQDLIEKTLIESGNSEVSKAYILYRKQHQDIRDTESYLINAEKVMDGYLEQLDWRVNENSNVNYSYSGLHLHVAGSVIANYTLNKVYPKEVAEAHKSGDFHIHDLSMGIAGYCAGWSLRQLLEEGFNGVLGKTEAKPAKHLGSALWQMINFIGTLQNEWAGAQAFSSFDTYLAPFIKADKLSYDEVKQHMQGFIFNMNIPSRWGTQCVTEDTECLTNNGWKLHDEIDKKNDKIATINVKTGKVEYLDPLAVTAYDYEGELIRIKNRTQDHAVTLDHKVLRKKFNSEEYVLEEAKDLLKFKSGIVIPNSGITTSRKEIKDYEVELYAWLVAEGCFSEDRGRISLFQSEKNSSKVQEIRECLTKNNITWHEFKGKPGFSDIPTIRFRFNQRESNLIRKKISSKKIPLIISELSERQIKLFIDTYIKGDGHKDTKGRMRIYTKDIDVLNSIQELCALVGYGTSVNQRENKVYQINIIRNKDTLVKLSKVQYKGKVWCPTTRNGTFIARRKGTVFATGNTPFSNLTFDWVVPTDMKDKKAIVGGKRQDFTYGDCQKEMDILNKAFIEVMQEGDASGRIFTFPIPTYNITKDFNWESDNARILFEMTAKYGIPYFQNFVNSSLNPEDVRSMCCRLQMDLRELKARGGGLFGSAEMTGSLGVVTINLPRIGYLSETKEEMLKRIETLMNIAKESLEIKRKIVNKHLEHGLLPFSKRYLGTLQNHFNTIGVVGMNELIRNFTKDADDITTKSGQKLAVEILEFMREKLTEFQEETGNLYNLEATPAEGTSYRLARIDYKKYPKIIHAGDVEPYYTNSTQLPVGFTADVFEALDLQDNLQTRYTGGTVLHGFIGEKIQDAETVKKLLQRVTANYRLPYFSVTPTFSICENHGYIAGEHFSCPTCQKSCEVFSRVVGYLRPVQQWNKGKKEEYEDRKTYEIKVSLDSKRATLGKPLATAQTLKGYEK